MTKPNLKLNLTPPSSIGKSFALVEPDKPPGIREIQAMAFWHSPDSGAISFLAKVQSGCLLAPFKF